jgi:hypothetical protein
MRSITLFTLFGVKTTISPLGLLSFLVSIPVLGWIAAWQFFFNFGEAWLAGLLTALVLVASEWLHQMSHARAAHDAGPPMIGIHFLPLFCFSTCLYPKDEPPLPPRLHVQRALGGFWVSLLIGLLLAPLAFFLWIKGGVSGWVLGVAAFWNVFVLGLGALLPVDIPGVFTTDGGTLLRLWRERMSKG